MEDIESLSSTTAPLSTFSKLEERRLKDLEQAFMEAADIIINDPLMDVFRQKEETQQFMFERIQEIISEGIREANDRYIKEVLMKMEEVNKANDKLKIENKSMAKSREELRNTIEDLQSKFNDGVEERVKSLSEEIECYKSTINVIQEESLKVETQNKSLIERLKLLEEKQASESEVEGVLKANMEEMELENEELKRILGMRDAELNKMVEKEKEFESVREMNGKLIGKVEEMEAEYKKESEMNSNLVFELQGEIKRLKDGYEMLSGEHEELQNLISGDSQVGKLREEIKFLKISLKQTSSDLDLASQAKDDLDFEKNQLLKTVEELKKEIKDMTQKLSMERKNKQSLENKLIEMKDGNSELNMINSDMKDELTSTSQEVRAFIKIVTSYPTSERISRRTRRV